MAIKHSTVIKLHPAVDEVIESYRQLDIGGKWITAPYFMNSPGRKGRRVSVGKGTALALERETKRLAKKHGFDLTAATTEDIRNFMVQHKLGIDCSGLVAWAMHAYATQQTGRPLWHHIQFQGHPLRTFAVRRLRPVENLSARLLTNVANSQTIDDMRQVKPGDIIRSFNGNHVLLITEVGYAEDGLPLHFRYVNSTEHAGIKYGVRYGLIRITNPEATILHQQWVDGEAGVNWLYKSANDFPDDTRVVRLRLQA